jgi:outer membrane cobalamin receptor
MPYLLFYKRGLRLLLCLALPVFARGQEDSVVLHRELPSVEVLEKARPSLVREGAPLQALDMEAALRLGIYDLPEAVKRFSGVELRDYGGIGGLKTVSVRGLGAQHTAVVYDGVTVTDAQSGQVDIGRFTLDRVESVTLSMGQTGDIFQAARSYASAGALSISTQKPQFDARPFRLEGQIRAGSFGFLSPSARYEQQLGHAWALSLNLSRVSADGDYPYTLTNGSIVTREKRKNSDTGSTAAELNLFGESPALGKLRVKAYGFDSNRGLPGSVVLYNDYHTERLRNRNAFVQALYERTVNGVSIKTLGKFDYSWTHYSDFHSMYAGGEQSDIYTQREYYASAVALYSLGNAGLSAAQDVFFNTLDATMPLCAFPRRLTSLTSLNAQFKNSRLTATAALLASYVTEEVRRGKAAGDRRRLSPSVALSYRLFPAYNFRVRASYKDIFRIPTFNDLYYDRIGNKDLSPEKAAQYNAGVTWSGSFGALAYLSLTADAYYNKVKDKIVAMPTMFIWKMMNMGEVEIRGVDVNLAMRFEAAKDIAVQVDGSYSRRKAIDVTRKESKTYGHQIPYTPLDAGSASVSVENRWVNIGWTLSVTGPRYVLPQNMEANRIDGYAEQQVTFNRTFAMYGGTLRLQAEALNLLDVNYDVIRYYPMPGRSFRISIRYSY